MIRRRPFIRLMAAAAAMVRGVAPGAIGTRAQQPLGTPFRVFAADSFSGDVLPVYEITGGQRADFATLNAAGWIGPLAAGPDGRLFAVTNANGGSLWDITSGGDLTSAQPIAASLFTDHVGYLEGLAFDGDGNAYIANGESDVQPIARVGPDGTVSYLDQPLQNPRGLVVSGQTLYAAEGSSGQVWAYDLSSGRATVFAKGFQQQSSHTCGQFVVDPRGRQIVLWTTDGGTGLYDLTNGGDFTGRSPLVPAEFRIDVNQIAVDPANAIYAAGDGDGTCYVSRFQNGAFMPFAPFATDLGDTESVAVLVG